MVEEDLAENNGYIKAVTYSKWDFRCQSASGFKSHLLTLK